MVASLLTGQEETRAFAELLRPEPLADGSEPEERLILCGVSWGRYLALDKALGDDRPSPRLYYLDSEIKADKSMKGKIRKAGSPSNREDPYETFQSASVLQTIGDSGNGPRRSGQI